MNILLIGGTGFIGSALIRYYSNDGSNTVICIGRRDLEYNVDGLRYFNVNKVEWSVIIEELCSFSNLVIIDLAYTSVPNTSFLDPIQDFSQNLTLVNNHLNVARQLDVLKYIYVSSGGTVYGNIDKSTNREDDPNFPQSPYGITKMACERYVHMYHVHYGLNTNIVRPSNVYGPGQLPFRGQGFIATALGAALKQGSIKIFGDGEQIRDYIYIDDFCEGIDSVIKHSQGGEIYNIGSGVGLTINELLQMVDELIAVEGYQLARVYEPLRLFDVRKNILDIERIRALSSWEPEVTIAAGIGATWEWLKNNYEL
jgi:UDP-glucose 4-epimerase